jgi:hypothetical protein
MICVGNPILRETFRVSMNLSRAFTDQVLPLAAGSDSLIDASLSLKVLRYSSYGVQSVLIAASEARDILTPSDLLTSGFRLKFGLEKTSSTNTGGENGCLKWDGTAAEIKLELETLLNLDKVEVSKEVVTNVTIIHGKGIKYLVTFVGEKVRGNVPLLHIVDNGVNGCVEAHFFGGHYSQDLGTVLVTKERLSYIPSYKMQTTQDLPFDATELEVKGAIESLSQACLVEVSREIGRHGNIWDVTFSSRHGDPSSSKMYESLMVMVPNGNNMKARSNPLITITGLHKTEVEVQTPSISYYARISAMNSFGQGTTTKSNPVSVQPASTVPGLPTDIIVEPLSDTEILVQWEAPLNDQVSPITHFKIEYDESSAFDSNSNNGPRSIQIVSADEKAGISDIHCYD